MKSPEQELMDKVLAAFDQAMDDNREKISHLAEEIIENRDALFWATDHTRLLPLWTASDSFMAPVPKWILIGGE